jgi:hypothetical protein
MAFRLVNLHPHPLRVELRGGGTLVLPPGARSIALREELLYDNDHVAEWEHAGWLRRLPARMSDVAADEAAAAMPATPAPARKAAPAAKGRARASPAKPARAAAKQAAPQRGASRKSGKR